MLPYKFLLCINIYQDVARKDKQSIYFLLKHFRYKWEKNTGNSLFLDRVDVLNKI